MNLYLRCSASAKSHLRLHLSRLPPLPADSHTHHVLHLLCTHSFAVSCSLMRPPVSWQAFVFSLMQPHVAPCFMAGSCLQGILSDRVDAGGPVTGVWSPITLKGAFHSERGCDIMSGTQEG